MNIVIHGTKGGFSIFSPKRWKYLLDVSADTDKSNGTAIGKQVYAIRFKAGNTMFSKYQIIRDILGDRRTGFIGFSLLLPDNESLSGTDITNLLDRVSDEYCYKYIVDNNLEEVEEDWDFLDRISSEYETKILTVLSDNTDTLQYGSKDDAFIYYSSTDELQRYFDVPFQEEYNDYRQILFISNIWRGKPESPINALRHTPNANLTGKIDLTKREYKLKDFYGVGKNGSGITIKIQANSKWLSNNDKITNKDLIEIAYLKDDCYVPIREYGKLNDDNIKQYLIIDEERKKIEVKRDVKLKPQSQIITFVITDSNSGPMIDSEIQIGNSIFQKVNGLYYDHTFEGEDLKKHWTVSCRKGDFFGKIDIKPLDVIHKYVDLKLKKRRVIEIRALFKNGESVFNLPLSVKMVSNDDRQEKIYHSTKEITFEDEEITKNWTIEISAYEEKIEYSGKKVNYSPLHGEKPVTVFLENKKGSSIGPSAVPVTGNVSIHQEKKTNENNSSIWDNVRRWFQEDKNQSKIFAGIIVFAIAILAIFFKIFIQGENPPLNIEDQIKQYVEGDTLFPEKLKGYKVEWEKRRPEVNKEGGSWLSIFGIGSEGEKSDSTDYQKWDEVMQSIDRAIVKRDLVNQVNFEELKRQRYSDHQQEFKRAIEGINTADYENVRNQLESNNPYLTLTQIATSITAILNSRQTGRNQRIDLQKDRQVTPETTLSPNKSDDTKPSEQSPKPAPEEPKNTDEIVNYLRGDEFERSGLETYKTSTNDKKLKKSIDLALKFWALNGTPGNSYSAYQKQLANDNHLKNSKLKTLVDHMCETTNPDYVIELPETDQDKSFKIITEKLK
ncbi:hypothetical protein [Runella sp.]|uniref:hypothetical protein n=1 Tax=Runella sp. TaxID=1960881 RepID=UPI0030191D82